MKPDTVVCWRWTPHKLARVSFSADTVNTLRAQVARHYPHPHRFVCVTDDTVGIDPRVEVIPAWNDYADVPSPHGGKNPSCYRRLRMFHPEAAQWFGTRFVALDLDAILVRDMTPVWDRPEDFVIWGDKTNPRTPFNGSMMLLTAGSRTDAWTKFDPKTSPAMAMRAGYHGSDQGWLSYLYKDTAAKWTRADGVFSFRNHIERVTRQLPETARIVFWHGDLKPWSPGISSKYPWVAQHYVGERIAVAS
jgi:hypothetical protein